MPIRCYEDYKPVRKDADYPSWPWISLAGRGYL